jgi:hypothetical protein
MRIKLLTFSIIGTTKFTQNGIFGSKNKPSGNHDEHDTNTRAAAAADKQQFNLSM